MLQQDYFTVYDRPCRKLSQAGQLRVSIGYIDKMAILQTQTAIFNKAEAADTIPLYFKKVLIAVKWPGSCLGEHRLDCPGQMRAVY